MKTVELTIADESTLDFKAENIKDVNDLARALEAFAPSFDKIPGLTDTFTEAATHLRTLGESSSFPAIISSLVTLAPLFRAIENHVAQCPVDASNKEQFKKLNNILDELKSLIPQIQPNIVNFMPGNLTTLLSYLFMIPFINNKTERAFSSVASCASGITCLINFKLRAHESAEHIALDELVTSTKAALDIKDPMPANQTLMPLAFLSRTIFRAIAIIAGNPALKEDPAIAAQIAAAVIEATKAHQKIMDRRKQLEDDKNNVAFYDLFSTPILANQIHFCTQCEFEFDAYTKQLREIGILPNQNDGPSSTIGFMLSGAAQGFIPGADKPPSSPKSPGSSLQNN